MNFAQTQPYLSRAFNATPKGAGTPFPSSGRGPESTCSSWAGLRVLLSPNWTCPVSQQPMSCWEQGSCPPPESFPQCLVPPGTPGSSAQPLSGFLCGSVLGDSVFPPIWGDSRASGAFCAAASSPWDGRSPNDSKVHFIQDTLGGGGSNFLGSSWVWSSRPRAVVLLSPPFIPKLPYGEAKERTQGLVRLVLRCSVQAGYSRL